MQEVKIQSDKLDFVNVGSLKYHPKNVHTHDKEQIDRLCKLIEYQGFRVPVIVKAGTSEVVAGNGRLEAARKLGMKKIPVMYQEFDNDDQLFAFLVSDNAIGKDTWATLDLSAINLELENLGPDLDIDMLGLKDFVIEPIEKLDPQTDEDEVPEVENPITKRGDIWLLGNHRVMCGDSTMIDDVEKLMAGEKADMVFTDPPYRVISGGNKGFEKQWGNSNFSKNDGKIFKHNDLEIRDILPIIEVVTVENCHIYIMTNFLNLKDYLNSIDDFGFKQHGLLLWQKDVASPNRWYCKNVEYTIFARKGGAFPINDLGSKVCESFKTTRDKKHPTQKPVELIERYIKNSSIEKSTTIDPFLGSGSTLIACEKTNRKCYGMELDEKYCDVIINRWQNYTGKEATLESTGETYNSLKANQDGAA